jgi:hypothetical protein
MPVMLDLYAIQCPMHACLYLLSFLSVVHPYMLPLESRGQSHGVTHIGLAKYEEDDCQCNNDCFLNNFLC